MVSSSNDMNQKLTNLLMYNARPVTMDWTYDDENHCPQQY